MITATYLNEPKEFRSAADMLRWLAEHTYQHSSKRTVREYYLGSPESHGDYWLRERTWLRLSKEDYAHVYRVNRRYGRYYRHMEEKDPEWQDGKRTCWGDNSVDMVQHSRKYPGVTRTVQLVGPHGDACY
ncbi:hypothetical protein [Nonomuraea basaltis]|uniref:hypothetical protein n=1 Tax=Nonomuraea basaltis TaxID=2495887 RepID=UPI00110C6DAF|nr:hypothetical protein [Nonomuraea basaltis]TMR92810.1 hypothetical protein EJK15_42405 [Nonomuraea basaltis]